MSRSRVMSRSRERAVNAVATIEGVARAIKGAWSDGDLAGLAREIKEMRACCIHIADVAKSDIWRVLEDGSKLLDTTD